MTAEPWSVAGKVCLVTGAYGGMGKAIATELARQGAIVELVCRRLDQGEALKREISRATGNHAIDCLAADLSDQAAIRRAAEMFRRRHPVLHVLVNNAGAHFRERRLSVDGVELHLAVNHLAPFLLTRLVSDRLRAAAPARVVNVASHSMAGVSLNLDDLQSERSFEPMAVYGRSKLALLMTGYAFARRLAGAGVTVNALHPGLVSTSIIADAAPPVARPFLGLIKLFLLSAEDGAKPALHLAAAPELMTLTGAYFIRTKRRLTSPQSYDLLLQERLWDLSSRLVRLEADGF